jgi:hypothetical protein
VLQLPHLVVRVRLCSSVFLQMCSDALLSDFKLTTEPGNLALELVA